MTAIVVGIGQDAAGDDGVGLAVARVLAARGLEVRERADASIVLELAAQRRALVIVDAVVHGDPPGTVIRIAIDALATGPAPLSSHGLGVAEAIALARELYGEIEVAIVGVVIEPPRMGPGLSPAVAAAIEPAAALAARLAGGFARARGRDLA